jgi:hypothetical protein
VALTPRRIKARSPGRWITLDPTSFHHRIGRRSRTEEEGRYPQNDEILGYSRPIGRAAGKRDA